MKGGSTEHNLVQVGALRVMRTRHYKHDASYARLRFACCQKITAEPMLVLGRQYSATSLTLSPGQAIENVSPWILRELMLRRIKSAGRLDYRLYYSSS